MLRRLPALFLVLTILAALFSGCTTEPIEPETALSDMIEEDEIIEIEIDLPEREEPETADRLSEIGIAWQSDAGLHPYTSESITNQMIMSLLYESLFVVNSAFEAQPLLCKSCSASEDNKVWRLDLRSDITFSDGTVMTADDVVASLRAACASALYQTRFEIIRSIHADGEFGINIWLDTACENLPLILDVPIVKSKTISSETPTGSGPYVRSGQSLVLNQNWWQDVTPKINAQTLKFIEANDAQSVRNAFEFGGADLAYTDPCATSAADYHCDYELWNGPTTVMQYIGFNQNSNYFFSSTLRSGVTYAVDRDTIIADTYGGFGLAATLPCSPLSSVYESGLASSYTYNPGAFQACLIASKISPNPGKPINFIVCSSSAKRVSAANTIADELIELGLYVKVTPLDTEKFRTALSRGNFDMYLAEIRLPPNFDLRCFFQRSGSASYGLLANNSLVQLCDRSLENSGNYYDLFRTIMNRGLICPIMFKSNALYASRGIIEDHLPALSNLFSNSIDLTLADILSETPYEAPEEPSEEPEPEDSPEDPGADDPANAPR